VRSHGCAGLFDDLDRQSHAVLDRAAPASWRWLCARQELAQQITFAAMISTPSNLRVVPTPHNDVVGDGAGDAPSVSGLGLKGEIGDFLAEADTTKG